jgi:hypothetical protein
MIDESQIDDIDAELGIDDGLQRSQDVVVHLTTSLEHSATIGLLRVAKYADRKAALLLLGAGWLTADNRRAVG